MPDPLAVPLEQSKRQYLVRRLPASPVGGMTPASFFAPMGSQLGGAHGVSVGPSVASQEPLTNTMQRLKLQGLDIDLIDTLKSTSRAPFSVASVFGGALGSAAATPEVAIASMTPQTAESLKSQSGLGNNMQVEEDSLLQYGSLNLVDAIRADVGRISARFSTSATIAFPATPYSFVVAGEGGQPLPNATILLYGDDKPAEGKTDANGRVTIQFQSTSGRPSALLVMPEKDHWDFLLREPSLQTPAPNAVRMTSYRQSVPGFLNGPVTTWGQRIMGFSQATNGDNITGAGIRIAIIDSGCDNTHPLLQHIQQGLDCTSAGAAVTWNVDVVNHGTHCAGVIAAKSTRGTGMRGFAPEAEVHIFKIFPGGRLSDLIRAIDECISRGIDVVNLSLGSPDFSTIVDDKLREARMQGVACIAAVGNSGGAAQFPASSDATLGVAAIGQLNQFPSDSSHILTVTEFRNPTDGVFSPAFTCRGTGVDVCAPGVAVLSTVPGNGFKSMDGTSMATPHVTGLAAALLAHNPILKSVPRSAVRVDQLFTMLRQATANLQYPFGVDRVGMGMPTIGLLAAN